jgi:hypothetical protein
VVVREDSAAGQWCVASVSLASLLRFPYGAIIILVWAIIVLYTSKEPCGHFYGGDVTIYRLISLENCPALAWTKHPSVGCTQWRKASNKMVTSSCQGLVFMQSIRFSFQQGDHGLELITLVNQWINRMHVTRSLQLAFLFSIYHEIKNETLPSCSNNDKSLSVLFCTAHMPE